jgi:hypothetical protein
MAIGEEDLVSQCMIAPHKASEVQHKHDHHRSPAQGQGSMSTNLDTTWPQRPFLCFEASSAPWQVPAGQASAKGRPRLPLWTCHGRVMGPSQPDRVPSSFGGTQGHHTKGLQSQQALM